MSSSFSCNAALLGFLLPLAAAPALAAPPAAPSDVVAYCPNENRVHLSWRDNSDDETAWWVDRWDPVTETWVAASGGDLPADFEVWRGVVPSTEAQTIRLRVAPWKPGEIEANLNWVEAEVFKPEGPLDLFIDVAGRETPEGSGARAGESISFQVQIRGGSPDRYIARDLPAGLSLDENTGLVTGTIAAPGVYRCFLGVEFDGEERFERAHFFRVLPAPSTPVVADPAFSVPVQNAGVRGFINLGTLFADPARERGAWIETGGASIILALHETAAPKTVENFLGYVRRGDYDRVFVHRAIDGFIFQSGGFAPFSPTAPATTWRSVVKRDNVQNEPGLSNVRGTISMAKMGGQRDSATSEWFLNIHTLQDNPGNLDLQNGGFTAFGQIVGAPGFGVMDAIGSLETSDRNLSIDGSARFLENVPLLNPANPNSFLLVDSVSEVRPIHISLVSNSAPQVVATEVVGPLLFIDWGSQLGTASIVLRATNADGNTVDFTLPIRVADRNRPTVRLVSLRAVRPVGTILMRGRAEDDVALARWRYRVNNRRWINGGRLAGRARNFTARARGFRRGRNLIRIQAFDRSGNRSAILTQRLTFR